MFKRIVSYQDFHTICRFCLKNTISLTPLFNLTNGKGLSLDVNQVIRECLNLLVCIETSANVIDNIDNIKVYMGDGLPDQICTVCHNKVLEYYEFWKQCHSATEILHEICKNQNVQMDVKVEYEADRCDSNTNDIIDRVKAEDDISIVSTNNVEISNSKDSKMKLVKLKIENTSDAKVNLKRSMIPVKKLKNKKSDLEICPICGIKLRCLSQHMKTHFQKQNLKFCDICEFSTVQKSNLQRHMHVKHIKEGKYACKICSSVFTDLRQLNRHKQIKHQERKHPCPHCKAIFHTSFGLTKHQTIHSGEKKHTCEECGKSYRMLDSLKAHRKRHLDPTIPCSYCAKMFYTKNELRSHVGLHTGVKAFQCDICTSAFIASSSLAVHRRKHKKANVLPTCKLCGKKFSDRTLLKMHLNDHKKDSPFN